MPARPAQAAFTTLACALLLYSPANAEGTSAAERRVRIVALGDSLTAGRGLPFDAAFPAKLQSALQTKDLAVEIVNAGVSGDTAARALARLDWSVPEGTDGVIVELGANDMLLGMDPKVTRNALEQIVRRLSERGIVVLLAGMRAAPNFGADYARAFEAIYSELATKYDVLLYPFFLDGVATNQNLNQPDGIHPKSAGVDVIVARILPKVEELLARIRQKHDLR
jgi:acyl-CoA thioesterase-1